MAKVISKKRLVTSYHNLSQELQEAVKELYPTGFSEEVSYLVKIDVKIDDISEEEDDKDFFDDEIKGADELGDDSHGEDDMSDDNIDI